MYVYSYPFKEFVSLIKNVLFTSFISVYLFTEM